LLLCNRYKMKNKLFSLALISIVLFFDISAQKKNKNVIITGRVTDFYNYPVSGALIMVDGKTTSAKTDSKGDYKIKVKPSVLQIGVFTILTGVNEEPVNGRTIINFKLDKYLPQTGTYSDDSGQKVVNSGYGVSRKNDATKPGTEADVSAKEYITFPNIYEMIRTLPGVMVNGSNVTIRGVQSTGNSSPLFIVNGTVVRSISGIDPSMVKSIDVLKGSSASVYGVQGANGVIVIQLK
jgi:TonB-dependent SusC/RagA subfamily outer membrane receptor